MKPSLARELAMDALLMVIWRRHPPSGVVIHSDQGVQYGGDDWRRFCREHGLEVRMSRRGNCWDNSVAESSFSSSKKERVRGRVYGSREEARSDLFDYIEVFYNYREKAADTSFSRSEVTGYYSYKFASHPELRCRRAHEGACPRRAGGGDHTGSRTRWRARRNDVDDALGRQLPR